MAPRHSHQIEMMPAAGSKSMLSKGLVESDLGFISKKGKVLAKGNVRYSQQYCEKYKRDPAYYQDGASYN